MMKPTIKIAFLFLGLLWMPAPAAFSQKFIRMDEGLKLNSQAMRAKRKGIRAVGKYEFGTYRVVSGKAGWTKTSSRSRLFSDDTSIKSSSNKSFVLVDKGADTAVANISVAENIEIDEGSWFIRTFTNWSDAEVKHGEGIFEVSFSFSTDTTLWNLFAIYPLTAEVDGIYQADDHTYFRGILTDNHRLIEIAEIHVNEAGKSSFLNPILGYEFWEGSISLAAVQVLPGNKWYVWIRDNLDPQMKFVLASAATAMLVKTF